MTTVADDFVDIICSRVSTPKLGLPLPTQAQLDRALACARRAPDHGRLRPWQFFVLTDSDLQALGETFEAAARMDSPALDEDQARRFRQMPQRAPMIVAVTARVTVGHKVPVWEQQIAAGVAAQHLQLVLHAMGFGCMWRTGEMASHPVVKARLGLGEQDLVVAWLYVGTPLDRPPLVEDRSEGKVFYGLPARN